MPTRFLYVFSPCFHMFECIVDDGVLWQTDQVPTLDCPVEYRFSPPPIETVDVRYYLLRCAKCYEDNRPHRFISADLWDNYGVRLACTRPDQFEAHVRRKLRSLLDRIVKDGVRPQLRISYGQDARSIDPELSMNDAINLAWPLFRILVEDTLRWPHGMGAERPGG